MAGIRPPAIPRPYYFDPAEFAFCTKCRKVKRHRAFPRSRNTKTGLHGWCLECNNAASKAWTYRSPENYQRRRYKQTLNQRRYREREQATG